MSTKHTKKVRIKWGRLLLAVFVVAAGVAALIYFNPFGPKEPVLPPPVPKLPAQSESEATGAAPKRDDLLIRCVGDIMAHMPQVNAAKQPDGSYDFTHNYAFVEQYFKAADLMMGNFETTFSGDGTYSGYPGFDSPEVLATNVRSVGVNVALFANNHMYDTRLAGCINTVNVLRANNFLAVVGARTTTDENRSAVIDIRGVKIGIVAYTYEGSSAVRNVNGIPIDPNYVNSFRYSGGSVLDEDLAAIKSEMDWCRANGAEILICYFHWGTEYKQTPNAADKALAQFVAENGADIIFASHPHVVQPIDVITVEAAYKEAPAAEPVAPAAYGEIVRPSKAVKPTTWTKTVPVYYSMGNFISNQRYESLGSTYGETTSRRTERGMIANVNVSYDRQTGRIFYNDISFIPTWVDRYNAGGRTYYYVVPLIGDFSQNGALAESGHYNRASSALSAMIDLIGEQYIYKGQ